MKFLSSLAQKAHHTFFETRQKRNMTLHIGLFVVIFLAVFITNFPFNGYFTGWDNLHPEFNFGLNFKRALSAVWQENQGLGTYGGHGYAATLPHTFLLWLMSFVLPDMYLRSMFTFLTLLIGGLGAFFLTKKLLGDKLSRFQNTGALFASLFYILNFGIVQNYYIQLEAFIVHFAALPWLFYSLILYFEKQTVKRFVVLFLISLIATIQGFIPPLFFVYMLLLAIFLASYVIAKPSFKRIKNAFIVGITTLLLNAYWFLPVAYYTFKKSSTYLNAFNNLASTEDFILKNKMYGNMENVSILKGFISEALDTSANGATFPIFSVWLNHFNHPVVPIIGFVFFGIIALGFLYGILKLHSYYAKAACIGGFLVFALLATSTVPLNFVTTVLHTIPAFKQAFRIAFTKFSISVALFYAMFFGVGVSVILSFVSNYLKDKIQKVVVGIIIIALLASLIAFSFPIFQGNFLYSRIKLSIPQNYFELFDYFKTQDKTARIAELPAGWNWGWSVYKWGDSTSGFLWYGIEQPIMHRSFDVWGKSNEAFYWELSHAVFSENFNSVDKIFEKYQVSYLVFDKNIIPYQEARGFFYSESLEQYLDTSPKYKVVKTLEAQGASPIKIYQVNLTNPAKNYVDVVSNDQITNIGPSYEYANEDRAFREYGTYYTKPENYAVYYPFRTLFDSRKISELPIDITSKADSYEYSVKLPPNNDYIYQTTQIDPLFEELDATLKQDNGKLILSVPKIKQDPEGILDQTTYSSYDDHNFVDHKASNCIAITDSPETKQEIIEDNILRFTSHNSKNCYTILLDKMPHRYAYLLHVKSRHVKGKRLQVAVINQDSKKADIEVPLSQNSEFTDNYVIIPPMKEYGLSYALTFNNVSIGDDISINDIKSIDVQPFPYEYLSNIKLISQNKQSKSSVYTFYQSFDPDWKLYTIQSNSRLAQIFPFFFGTEIKSHVKVNNWANGWKLNQPIQPHQSIRIVYLPQYLEYAGLAILGVFTAIITTIAFFVIKRRS